MNNLPAKAFANHLTAYCSSLVSETLLLSVQDQPVLKPGQSDLQEEVWLHLSAVPATVGTNITLCLNFFMLFPAYREAGMIISAQSAGVRG